MYELDALIVNPSSRNTVYQKLGDNLAALEPPVWAALLANGLRNKGYRVNLLDCEALELKADKAAERIIQYKASLVVIVVYGQQPSASTQNMYGTRLLCCALKERDEKVRILLVGGHVSALPERTLLEESVDFVCQGEGLSTIIGLIECDSKDYMSNIHFPKVPGLWYMNEGRATFTYPALPISQSKLVKELPGMAFDLLPMERYKAHNWHCFKSINERQPYASIYTSLGCPFNCSFCCINAPFGKPCFRYWQPEFTIKQFDTLAEKYNVRNIKIADEMFVLNESHYLELCKLIKERGYGFNIWAYARIDTIKPHNLACMKEAGINWLALGIESGSKYVRDGVLKGRFSYKEIMDTVSLIKQHDINVIGNFIFGLPDDNYETMNETLDLALKLRCEMSNFYSAMAYPGSKLYETAVKNSLRLPDSWLGYSQYAYETLPLSTNHLSGGQVLAFRDMAWKKYFTDNSYLSFIESKFGINTRKHIEGIAEIDIKRKYIGE